MQDSGVSFSGSAPGNELASFNVASTSHEVGESDPFSSFLETVSEDGISSKFVKGTDGVYQVKPPAPVHSDGEVSSDEAREAEEELSQEMDMDVSSGFDGIEAQQAEGFETIDVIQLQIHISADVLKVVQQFIVSIHEKELRGERVQEYVFEMEDGDNSRLRIGVEKQSAGLFVDISADEKLKDLLLENESELRSYLAEKNITLAALRIV